MPARQQVSWDGLEQALIDMLYHPPSSDLIICEDFNARIGPGLEIKDKLKGIKALLKPLMVHFPSMSHNKNSLELHKLTYTLQMISLHELQWDQSGDFLTMTRMTENLHRHRLHCC